jgi:hypothetical protein
VCTPWNASRGALTVRSSKRQGHKKAAFEESDLDSPNKYCETFHSVREKVDKVTLMLPVFGRAMQKDPDHAEHWESKILQAAC